MLESGDTKILFDPFLKRWNPALPPLPLEECSAASAVFITHPHLDHFADINVIGQHCSAPVYVAERGIVTAGGAGYETNHMKPIRPGETYRIGPFCVEVYQSRHCVFDMGIVLDTLHNIKNKPSFEQGLAIQKRNKLFSIGKEDIFAFDVKADEKEIFILGSANTEKKTAYPREMDLLVFPYQGRSNMASYALPFLDMFRPKKVMLDHFDDAFPPISRRMDCAAFMQKAAEEYPHIEVFEPTENTWYTV